MSVAASLPDQPAQSGPAAEAAPGRFAPLLSLVRRIIDYGRQLAAALQNPTPATDLDEVAATFGSYDFGQILASVLRGLQRAGLLQAKLTRLDARPAPEPRPATIFAPRKPRATTQPTPGAEEAPTANPIRLPTPEQIAKQVRSGPIGVVLADICRDLGITKSHPLWRELFTAIIRYDGSLARLGHDIGRRPWLDRATREPIIPGVPLFRRAASAFASTGPPA